ncbi:MAG: phosphotransferase, partial [Geminicoccaceae bacterium]
MPGSGTYPALIGFDDQGREVLTYIPGESGRAAWTKVIEVAGLVAMGRLLRTYHDVVADYRPAGVAAGEVMCHGDFGPWNLVRHGVRPVGILDWDEARPARPVFDLAYALEYVVPFRDDDTCRRWLAYPAPPDRR